MIIILASSVHKLNFRYCRHSVGINVCMYINVTAVHNGMIVIPFHVLIFGYYVYTTEEQSI